MPDPGVKKALDPGSATLEALVIRVPEKPFLDPDLEVKKATDLETTTLYRRV
jgi:hypothetical protein